MILINDLRCISEQLSFNICIHFRDIFILILKIYCAVVCCESIWHAVNIKIKNYCSTCTLLRLRKNKGFECNPIIFLCSITWGHILLTAAKRIMDFGASIHCVLTYAIASLSRKSMPVIQQNLILACRDMILLR